MNTSGLSERNWPAILVGSITVNVNGIVSCTSTKGLRVKQLIQFNHPTNGQAEYQIKKVLSDTTFVVGDPTKPIGSIVNPQPFNGGTAAVFEQNRNSIGDSYVIRSVYEEEPIMALRNVLVDKLGNIYDENNPLPVSLEIDVPTLDVELDAFTKVPPDNVLMVGSEDATVSGIKHAIKANPDGSIESINLNTLITSKFDTIAATYPSSTVEVYTYRTGGISGTIVGVITVAYTDATKNYLDSVMKT